jgi:hypothetical protein
MGCRRHGVTTAPPQSQTHSSRFTDPLLRDDAGKPVYPHVMVRRNEP